MYLSLKVVAFVFVINSVHAGVFDWNFESAISTYVENLIKCRHIPGLTLAVVKGDETWSQGYGTANIDTQQNVTNQSVFAIGSLSKAFTSTLLAKLLSTNTKGYNWETKVKDILGPEYRFTTDSLTENITLRDLLAHRTGLAENIMFLGFTAGIPHNMPRAELCRRIKFVPSAVPFRDIFHYNNGMYMLAGHVAEVLAGDSWENLVQKHLFDPIGMSRTRILRNPGDILKDDNARPYIIKEDETFENGTEELYTIWPAEPAGAVLTSADDMTKWMKFHLRQGITYNNETLVKKDVLTEAYRVHMHIYLDRGALKKPTYPVGYSLEGYGYSWFMSTYRGYDVVWHSGGINSYISFVWLLPDMDIGIFVSTSGPHSPEQGEALPSLFYYITDNLLKLPSWLNSTSGCTFPEPWINTTETGKSTDNQTGTDFPFNADEYIGSYGTYLTPDIRVHNISNINGTMSFDLGKLDGKLLPQEHKDNFTFVVTDPWEFRDNKNNVTFLRSIDGTVNGLLLFLDAPIIFTKGLNFTDKVPLSNGTDRSEVGSLTCGCTSIPGSVYTMLTVLNIYLFI